MVKVTLRSYHSIPLTSHTISFVENRTFRLPPFQVDAFARMLSISCCKRSRKLNAVLRGPSLSSLVCSTFGEMSYVPEALASLSDSVMWREGMTIRNESSVSRCAERELRFVDPKRVKIGGDLEDGDSQMPDRTLMQLAILKVRDDIPLA